MPIDTLAGSASSTSRLILGTGGFPRLETLAEAIRASGTELVTVALRRIDPGARAARSSTCSTSAGVELLPNTAGCFTARDAVLTAQLAREAFDTDWVKLEVIGDERTLLPDAPELLAAAEELVADGFTVLPYTTDDPVLARRLEDVGCAAVMPLGSPIGSRHGDPQPVQPRADRRAGRASRSILDAGVGHRQRRGAGDGARLRRGPVRERDLARQDPVAMARAIRAGVEGGRLARGAGRIPRRLLRRGVDARRRAARARRRA